jgi:hypothetical protein
LKERLYQELLRATRQWREEPKEKSHRDGKECREQAEKKFQGVEPNAVNGYERPRIETAEQRKAKRSQSNKQPEDATISREEERMARRITAVEVAGQEICPGQPREC